MNNDLISREALKKALELTDYNDSYDLTITERLIDNAPTVDIKDEIAGAYNEGYMCGNKEAEKARPQGEWVVTKLQNIHSEDVYCPFCNARPTRSEYGYYLRDNFCHECGADMRVYTEIGKKLMTDFRKDCGLDKGGAENDK